MKRIIVATFVIFISMPRASAETIRIICGLTPYEVIFAGLKDKFEKASGDKLVFVSEPASVNPEQSFKKVLSGEADMAFAASGWVEWQEILREKKAATDAEIAQIAGRLVAHDLLTFITHPSVGVSETSREHLADLFSGKTKKWSDLGGRDVSVKVVVRDSSAAYSFFKKYVLKQKGYSKTSIEANTIPDIAKTVAKTEGAVGIVSGSMKHAGVLSLKTPEIGRPVTVITKGKPTEQQEKLLKFIAEEMRRPH